jgi:quinol-cytochrome oxidoreductase complex cytochrome b subunit
MTMLSALVAVLVIAIVAALIYWIIDQVPVPEPLNRWCKLAVIVIAAIALIYVLLGLGGYDLGRLR